MKIEKKNMVWPWILGLGLVAALIYFIGFYDQKETAQQNVVTVDLINVKEKNRTVAAFIRLIETDTMKMELDHTFTGEALLKLVDATNAMAGEIQFDIRDNMDRVILSVNRTIATPIATTSAADFRQAADILTSVVLKSMQQAKYPGLNNEVVQIENAVSSIQPDVLILDQKEAIKSYFKKTANLLKKMN